MMCLLIENENQKERMKFINLFTFKIKRENENTILVGSINLRMWNENLFHKGEMGMIMKSELTIVPLVKIKNFFYPFNIIVIIVAITIIEVIIIIKYNNNKY